MDPLQNASKQGNIDALYAAIEDNPRILSIFDEIPFVDTPLHIAASSGHVEFALEIMRLKPSFATKLNPKGFTPIHIAIRKNYTQMVLCFVDMDPELVRVKGREGVTPLHLVVKEGNINLLQRFLSVCADSIQDKNVRYETALHIALKNSKFEAFQLLLDRLHKDSTNEETNWLKKRVLNCKDLEGNTLLHISTLRNQFQFTESLITYNKSNPGMLQVNAMNDTKQTATDIAIHFHDNLQIYPLLHSQMAANHDYDNPNPVTETDDHDDEIEVAGATTNINVPRKSICTRFLERYFMYRDRKGSSPDKTRSDLLVVAVLMATATYQAVLSPPGGVDDKTGIALLGRTPITYAMFMFFNSVGFIVSLRIIMVLLYNYPLFWDLYVASIAMAITYNSAMISITPSGRMRLIFFLLSIIMPIAVAVIAVEWRKYVYKKKTRAEETCS